MGRTLEEIEKELKQVQAERDILDKKESKLWKERQKAYEASIESLIDSKFKVGKSYLVFRKIDYHCTPITIIQLLEKRNRSFKEREVCIHFYDSEYNVITKIDSIDFESLDSQTSDNCYELTDEQANELINKFYSFDSLNIADIEKEVEELRKQYAN